MYLSNLRIGDRLIRQKGLFYHHGIYVGNRNGVNCIAENQRRKGVQFISYDDFMRESIGGQVRYQQYRGTEAARSQVLPRIEALVGLNYNLLFFNCEHFAEFVQTGKAVSRQVGAVALGAVLLLGVWALQSE